MSSFVSTVMALLILAGMTICGTGVAATPYPGGTWEPGPPRYGSVVVDHVSLTMDDGVVLDAAVAYPADPASGRRAAGRFPVVIEHTPYVFERIPPNRDGGPVNSYYAKYGYISVRLHSRGTGKSGGQHGYYGPREARDGAAVVQWAAHRLDGSDGRVAIVGCSFPGGYALGDAAEVGPKSPLKAVVAACIHLEGGGGTAAGVPTQGISFYYTAPERLMGPSAETLRFYRDFASEMLRGGDVAYARDFWNQRLPMSYAQKIVDNDVPVLLWTSWKDQVGIKAVRTYAAFQNAVRGRPIYAPMSADQPVTPRYQVIVGDWAHGRGLDNGIILQWFETWLRGVDTGLQKTARPMHLLELATNRWVNAARYPTVERYTPWYLAEKGALTAAAPVAETRTTLPWGDPAQPGHVLSYATPAFAQGATLSGPMSATLHASSSNTNLLIVARVFDVAPDGTATEVTRGTILGSLREVDRNRSWTDMSGTPIWPWQTLEKDSYLAPGQTYRLDIALEPRQWGIAPGHRLRLDLSTQAPRASCPGPEVNSSGSDPCYLTEPQKKTVPGGVYSIASGPDVRSALNLPLLPASAFPNVACSITPTSEGVCLPQDWEK